MAGCLKYGRKVYYQTAQSSLGCRTKAGRLAFRHELFHDLVDAEAGGFGAWREILEAFQPFRDKGLGSASEPNAPIIMRPTAVDDSKPKRRRFIP
jgi:hypothetical protein